MADLLCAHAFGVDDLAMENATPSVGLQNDGASDAAAAERNTGSFKPASTARFNAGSNSNMAVGIPSFLIFPGLGYKWIATGSR
jgi:hypothetical protein